MQRQAGSPVWHGASFSVRSSADYVGQSRSARWPWFGCASLGGSRCCMCDRRVRRKQGACSQAHVVPLR